jgi:hypothetical protein
MITSKVSEILKVYLDILYIDTLRIVVYLFLLFEQTSLIFILHLLLWRVF